MNASFTKLCEDLESSRAQNGQRGLWAARDVSDRKKELGERDVVFKQRWCMLLLCWQPFWHVGCGGLPVSLPGLTLGDLQFLTLLGLCQVSPAVPVT